MLPQLRPRSGMKFAQLAQTVRGGGHKTCFGGYQMRGQPGTTVFVKKSPNFRINIFDEFCRDWFGHIFRFCLHFNKNWDQRWRILANFRSLALCSDAQAEDRQFCNSSFKSSWWGLSNDVLCILVASSVFEILTRKKRVNRKTSLFRKFGTVLELNELT